MAPPVHPEQPLETGSSRLAADRDTLARELLEDAERRLRVESLPRIERALAALDDEALWWRPGPTLPSAGNLLLHLTGNVRQWLLAGLGGAVDSRERDREFSEPGPLPREIVLGRLRETVEAGARLLRTLPAEALERRHAVQAFEESGVAIVLHVVEHFSYHTGQIAFLAKLRSGQDLGFYAGIDLNRRAPGHGRSE